MGWTDNLAGRAERPPALTVSISSAPIIHVPLSLSLPYNQHVNMLIPTPKEPTHTLIWYCHYVYTHCLAAVCCLRKWVSWYFSYFPPHHPSPTLTTPLFHLAQPTCTHPSHIWDLELRPIQCTCQWHCSTPSALMSILDKRTHGIVR